MELLAGISLATIEQWGYGNSESTQTFPIKFTNSVIGIYGSKRAIITNILLQQRVLQIQIFSCLHVTQRVAVGL